MQITVREQGSPPLVANAPADQTGATGDIVGINVPAATGGRAPYVYSYSGLPPETGGLGRLIQGRLITSGSYTVTVTVTDANGDTDTDTFDWTVTGTDIAPPAGLNVRIDWGEQFFANPHADVTARIRSGVSCERGKTTGASTLGRTASGKLSLTLDNSDGLFDQENSASALFGLIRPGIMVQFRNGAEPLWSGVLDSIPSRYDKSPAAQHRATVTAYGLYSTLTEAPVADGSLSPETTAQAFCTLLESIGEMGVPQTGTFATMARWWERGSMKDALQHIEDTEGGFIYEDRKLDLGFQPAGHRASLSVSKTFSGVSPLLAGEIPIVGIPQRQIAVKDVVNTVSGYVRDFEEVTDQVVFTLGSSFAINRGTTIDLFFDWEEGGALESVADPTAFTDYAANGSTLTGPGRTGRRS